MIRLLCTVLVTLVASVATAQSEDPLLILPLWEEDRTAVFDATGFEIEAFRWVARPVVVFAESPADPRFRQQMDLLAARPDDLADRDVIILVDTDPDAQSAWRTRLRPNGFMLVIMGKDGEVELRKPAPWDVREITRTIDKMPLRQQELRIERGIP